MVLARSAVKLGNDGDFWNLLALGVAEYRSSHFAEADGALTAALGIATNNRWVAGTSPLYRAMSLFQQGKEKEARQLAITAATRLKPLPVDEKNPLAGGTNHDNLIVWMAYKEAKAMIPFDAAPAAPATPERK